MESLKSLVQRISGLNGLIFRDVLGVQSFSFNGISMSTTNDGDKRIKTRDEGVFSLIGNPKANLSFFAFFEPSTSYQKSS